MSSKRKRKKQEAKAAIATASQMGNSAPKAKTSVADAITKAKDKQKVKSTKKPDAKVITGFGRKIEGAVIHALTDLHGSALCDHRITGIEIQDYLIPKDVTCAKCQKYVVFKQLLATPVVQKPTKKKDIKTKKADPKSKQTEEKKKDIPTDAGVLDTDLEVMENLKGLLSFKLKKMEKRIVNKLEKHCEMLLDAKPRFFIVRKANNMYQIVHDASRYVICDNVKESLAEELLNQYLTIEHRWDGQSKPSPKWLGAIRQINEKQFPKEAKKTEKRKLKRRPRPSIKKRKDAKPEKRIIKRRSK